jgi:hypothetical protein
MEFGEQELKVLQFIVAEHIKQVKETEEIPDAPPALLGKEMEYVEILENIHKKLSREVKNLKGKNK